jgi:predicted house-cleaning noncanonical NTP pyrophosphatase (MazG superfamily)
MKVTKLVRDKIPELMQQQGKEGVVEQVTGPTLDVRLRQKLIEEAHEVQDATNRNNLIEELADIAEVIHILMQHHSIDDKTVEICRVKKKEKRGGFEKGYVYTYEVES